MCFFGSLSGYCDALVFKDLADTDITKIEQFMREKALDEFATTLSKSFDEDCDALVHEEQMVEIFGEKYASCPEKFQFLPGEVKLLKVLASHVKDLVDGNGVNIGLAQFSDKKKKNKKKNVVPNRIAKNRSQKSIKISRQQLNSQLFERLLICLNAYGVNVNDWSEHSVEVDASGSYGNVQCSLCDENEKPKRVFYQMRSRSGFWVFSNFNKHLENVHSLVSNHSNKIKSKRMKDEAEDLDQPFTQEHINDIASDAEKKHAQNQNMCEDDSEQSLNGMDDSVQFVGSVLQHAPVQTNNNTDSWLYEQMSVQIQQMIAANLVNGESEQTMEFQLNGQTARSISIVETKRDGNCLFSALAHQLWPNEITSREHINKTKELRAIVVEHILNPQNYHLYESILVNRLDGENSVPTSIQCKMFVRFGLARKAWGGLESIKAVSNEFHVNVVIINEFGSCNMVTGSDTYNRTLVVAYRLNNVSVYDHYDSISDMDAESIFSAAEFIINK